MLIDLYKKHFDKGLVVIAVHSDPENDKGIEAAKEEHLPYAAAFDGGKFMEMVGAEAYPTFVLIDKKGVIRNANVGYDGLDKEIQALLKEK